MLIFFVHTSGANAEEPSKELTIGTFYRTDRLNWNKAGSSVNVLSELEWKDMESYGLAATFEKRAGGFAFFGGAAFGSIVSGKNRDSDYSGNDRSGEMSRSENGSDNGYVLAADAGMGYDFILRGGAIGVRPLAGLSLDRQHLTVNNGNQVIPATGSFPGLDSSYTADWYGPFVGVDAAYALNDLSLNAGLKYHFARYYASADWNLRADLAHPVSFEHSANARGLDAHLTALYRLNNMWSLVGGVSYQLWKTYAGEETMYYSDGTSGTARLNRVNWESSSLNLSARYEF